MAGRQYSMEPKNVPQVDTPFRRIVTPIPVPESIPILERLRTYEPQSMSGQPLVIWDRAEGVNVFDKWGNMWLDWSCGVLVTNAGHGRKEIVDAIVAQATKPMLHNYCFPSEARADLTQKLVEIAPEGLDKAFLLTTGSEATENAIKLSRTHGQAVGGPEKIVFVSYVNGFHGRTLGSQQAGGMPGGKAWIGNLDPGFVQVPFPDGFRGKDLTFDGFLNALASQGVDGKNVCGVMLETYQGAGCNLAPKEYIQKLRAWCDAHDALLIFDEVQAGFGRTGKMFGFEHYETTPDLFCCGKGISSGMPLSAVVGRDAVMNQFAPGAMTSTHTGNPVCVRAALASIRLLIDEGLVENAAKMGEVLFAELGKIAEKHARVVRSLQGQGLVAGMHICKEGSEEPDADLAFEINGRCIEKGLLMFSPVGPEGEVIKIAPPLCITEDAVREGCAVLAEAMDEVC